MNERMSKPWLRRTKQHLETMHENAKRTQEPNSIWMRFLPTALLQVVGISGESVLSENILTEQKELCAVILNANISGFQNLVRGMEMKEIYRLINEILSLCVPVIEEKGGMIDRFEDAGLLSFFTGEPEDGLSAAILICEKIIRAGAQKKYQTFSACLCYGSVMIGAVGAGKKYAVLTLSEYTKLGDYLQKNAYKYYARILASGSYIGQIEGFEKKYHYRFLGLIYIKSLETEEKVYDIFDGDEAAIRNRKRKTKMLFEKGVGLFLDKEFAKARTYFIEVLKADRDDKAAREYVFLCDQYSNMPQKEKDAASLYITCL